MTTAQMRYFITVAECLSVTEAADRLYLSQPALSRHIAQMEAELNVPLFLRTRNTIRLTPAGQVLLEGLRQIYGDYRGLLERVEAVNAGVRGELRLGLLEEQLLPAPVRRALRHIETEYPNMKVRLSRHSFRALREGLLDGSLDCILSLATDLRSLPELTALVVERAPLYLVVGADSALAARTELAPAEFPSALGDQTFIFMAPEDSQAAAAEAAVNAFARHGFRPRYICAPNAELLALWVAAGQGVGLLNGNHVLIHDPEVRFVPLRGMAVTEMVLAWSEGEGNPVGGTFLEQVREQLQRDGVMAPCENTFVSPGQGG